MRLVEFTFPQIYPKHESRANILKVKNVLYDLYGEYVAANGSNESANDVEMSQNAIGGSSSERRDSSWSKFSDYVRLVETVQPHKSDLDIYLDEGCYICDENSGKFDVLEW